MNKKKEEQPQTEKVVTKYDRKVQKRKAQQLKEQKERRIAACTSIAVLVVCAIVLVYTLCSNYTKVHKEYIKVDNECVSQIAFDFYYNMTKSSILNTPLSGDVTYETYFTSYMGYDKSKADAKQKYTAGGDSNYTWYDYFANTTVSSIKEYKALNKAADEAGFTYDAEEAYTSFVNDLTTQAQDANMSMAKYYKSVFGSHATQKNVKTTIEEYLKAEKYRDQLDKDLTATDEEIASYYSEHKDDYDTVDYRTFTITAEVAGDVNALAAAKTKADTFANAITDDASFVELCKQYATEEQQDTYKDETGSLRKDATKASLDSTISAWLFDASRTAGNVTVIPDENNSAYTILYFINRATDPNVNETVGNQLLSNKYSEKISAYTDAMEVKNTKNRIKMLAE